MTGSNGPAPDPSIEQFLGESPTRDASAWRELWESDLPFPIRSHRGGLGRLVVWFKRLLRPLVRLPQNDLWERQRVFNLVVLDKLEAARGELAHLQGQTADLRKAQQELLRDLREVRSDLLRDVQNNHRRISHLEELKRRGFDDVMRHSDALYALLDQKLDRYRRHGQELGARLNALVELAEGGEAAELAAAVRARRYLEFEDRFRGERGDIAERVEVYLPYLAAGARALDLGCGRGELLELLAARGLAARGVDASPEMVRQCRERGLEAEAGDLFAALEAAPEGGLDAILSLHVVEHLPAEELPRLAALAWRALVPGGVLILETPNPLSLVAGASNFWIDPTHLRPVHPEALEFVLEQAGFDPVERLELSPFADEDRLPEIELAALPAELRPLAEQINGLRDRVDELLHGHQDYAAVGTRPAA